MKKNVTELVFLLDRSGSMMGLESDTIGGFNGMIKKQQQQDGDCFVTTILFDHLRETLHDRVPLERVQAMTDKEYTVRGSTALIDTLAYAIKHIEKIHRYIRPSDVPSKTMFVIITDGMENASRRYSSDDVKAMIERKKKENDWEFLFIGANIDAVETASRYGIGADRAVNYHADCVGTAMVYEAMDQAVSAARMQHPIGAEWRKKIDEDYRKRK